MSIFAAYSAGKTVGASSTGSSSFGANASIFVSSARGKSSTSGYIDPAAAGAGLHRRGSRGGGGIFGSTEQSQPLQQRTGDPAPALSGEGAGASCPTRKGILHSGPSSPAHPPSSSFRRQGSEGEYGHKHPSFASSAPDEIPTIVVTSPSSPTGNAAQGAKAKQAVASAAPGQPLAPKVPVPNSPVGTSPMNKQAAPVAPAKPGGPVAPEPQPAKKAPNKPAVAPMAPAVELTGNQAEDMKTLLAQLRGLEVTSPTGPRPRRMSNELIEVPITAHDDLKETTMKLVKLVPSSPPANQHLNESLEDDNADNEDQVNRTAEEAIREKMKYMTSGRP